MRTYLWLGTFLLACLSVGGCAGAGPGKLPMAIKPQALTASDLAGLSKPEGDKPHRLRRVAECEAARVYVVRTAGSVAAYKMKRDQAFLVVSGLAVVSLDGLRTEVGPGSVIVSPRGCKTEFIRGRAQGKAPLVMAQVVAPRGEIAEDLVRALAAAKKTEAALAKEKEKKRRLDPKRDREEWEESQRREAQE